MRQEYWDKYTIREINLFYFTFWLHCLIILLAWFFKISQYLSASEEIYWFGYTNVYHIDTFQKHGNRTAHSQHKASYFYWIDWWHDNRWKTQTEVAGLKSRPRCYFILKFQNKNSKYWTGFHHTSHSQSSLNLSPCGWNHQQTQLSCSWKSWKARDLGFISQHL